MTKRPAEFLILAIDIGTSSTRTALFDCRGRLLPRSSAAKQYSLDYQKDGAAELSPFILLNAARNARDRTLHAHRQLRPAKRIPVAVVAGSAFWHGLLGLNRKLQPITPVFTWADSRSTGDAQKLRERFDERRIQQRTGCMLRASFWPAKLRWLRRTQPSVFKRVSHWVSPSDWIFHQMFGDLRSSPSMASATGLFCSKEMRWDTTLMKVCGVDEAQLPVVSGTIPDDHKSAATVFCPIGDGAAGNLGSDCVDPGEVAINVGTSGAVRVILRRSSRLPQLPFGLFRYIVDEQHFVYGGAISNAGNLRQWCLQELRIDDENQIFDRREAASDPLTVLPFWVSERAPSWPEGRRGLIDRLSQATSAGQIARASTMATFYRLGGILKILEKSFGHARRIVISGGILQSPASLPVLADAIGRDVEVSHEQEASLRGAAAYALRQLGMTMQRPVSRKLVKHERGLAAKHRVRHARQQALEMRLSAPLKY